ncbi:MAG: TetR/AcrR family transcriptional regulator [Planctomycetota bacterium]
MKNDQVSTKRDQLLDAAARLFEREGFHAVGIDRVVKEAGVARMTLYNHFAGKHELIEAVLEHRDGVVRERFSTALERAAGDPRGQLLGVFDYLADWFATPGFAGCIFVKAAGEFTDGHESIREAAGAHKRRVAESLAELAREAGANDPDELACELQLVIEGATAQAQMTNCRAATNGHANGHANGNGAAPTRAEVETVLARARVIAELLIDRSLAGR